MVRRMAGAVAAASALTANAFLLPPGIQSIDDKASLAATNPDWRAIKLSCPECVMPTPKTDIKEESDNELDAPVFIMGGANSLMVNVTTLFDGSAVGLSDDYPLWPPLAKYGKAVVDMIPSEASVADVQSTSDRRTTVRITADNSIVGEEALPDGASLIQIKYHIMSVDQHPVTVDAIHVTCIKTPAGIVSILDAESVPHPKSPFGLPGSEHDEAKPAHPHPPSKRPGEHRPRPHHRPQPHKAPCNMPALLCEWRDFFQDKLSAMHHGGKHGKGKGCPGRKGKSKGHHKGGKGHHKGHHKGHKDHKDHDVDHPSRPFVDDDGVMHLPSHIRPHKGRPDHFESRPHSWGHHHRHHHSKFLVFAHRALMVLMPILVGISMGMFVSLIGMLVGRLIVFVWVTFVRGGRRGYASVRLSEEEAEAAEVEKTVDVEEANVLPPPAYEDAPAYDKKETTNFGM